MSASTFSLSVSIIILFSSFSTIDAKGGSAGSRGLGSSENLDPKDAKGESWIKTRSKWFGFFYICFGDGCTSEEKATSILIIFICVVLFSFCACLKPIARCMYWLCSNEDEITNYTNQRTNSNERKNADEMV